MKRTVVCKLHIVILALIMMLGVAFPLTVFANVDFSRQGSATEVTVDLTGQKIIKIASDKMNHVDAIPVPGGGWTTGEHVKSGAFAFDVIPDAKNPAGGAAGVPAGISTKEGGELDFGVWTFTKTGTYIYTVSEQKAAGFKKPADIIITIDVSKDSIGTFLANVKFSTENGLVFINERADEEDTPGTLILRGTKTYLVKEKPADIRAGQFSFLLSPVSGNADGFTMPADQTAQVKADGTFAFGAITFSKAGDYRFLVTENAGEDAGIQYDTDAVTVQVEVTEREGTLSARVVSVEKGGKEQSAISFENRAQEDVETGVSISLTGTKTLKGDRTTEDISAGEFTFVITPDAANPEGAVNVPHEVAVGDKGAIRFGTWSFQKEGAYVYTITEKKENRPGYTYDNAVYELTVEVKYSEKEERLYTETRLVRSGQAEQAEAITFVNDYEKPPETTTLDVTTPAPTTTPSVTTTQPYTTTARTTPPPGTTGNYTPGKTGDDANAMIWIATAIAALLVAVFAGIYAKRRN